jgi:hypothetical protein
MRRTPRYSLFSLVVLAVVACGSDDGGSGSTTGDTAPGTASSVPETTDAPDGGTVTVDVSMSEEELEPGSILGRTGKLQPEEIASLTVDLEAGNYVLLCNIVAGPVSHAGSGQTLDVSVG